MTLQFLQNEMNSALKNGNKIRKNTISMLIAQIKRAAIDKGCRDNITEDFINIELQKAKKAQQDSIDTCPEARQELLKEYKEQLEIINEFCPQLISDESKIKNIILDSRVFSITEGKRCQGKVMKFLKENYGGKIDMKIASKVFNTLF